MARPSEYKPEYAEKLIEHMSNGYSIESFGAVIGKSRQTIYNWADCHEDFKEAKERGETLSLYFWEKLGLDHIVTFDKDTKFNASVYIFTMKCRFNYRDGSENGKLKDLPDDTPPTDAEIRAIVDLATARLRRRPA